MKSSAGITYVNLLSKLIFHGVKDVAYIVYVCVFVVCIGVREYEVFCECEV